MKFIDTLPSELSLAWRGSTTSVTASNKFINGNLALCDRTREQNCSSTKAGWHPWRAPSLTPAQNSSTTAVLLDLFLATFGISRDGDYASALGNLLHRLYHTHRKKEYFLQSRCTFLYSRVRSLTLSHLTITTACICVSYIRYQYLIRSLLCLLFSRLDSPGSLSIHARDTPVPSSCILLNSFWDVLGSSSLDMSNWDERYPPSVCWQRSAKSRPTRCWMHLLSGKLQHFVHLGVQSNGATLTQNTSYRICILQYYCQVH